MLALRNQSDQAVDVIGVFTQSVRCNLTMNDERCDVRVIRRHLAPSRPSFVGRDPNEPHEPIAEGFD